MTVTEQIVTIFIVALVTQLTRWIPFWVFRSSAHTPQYVNYLGRVLPPAIFGMLVVYCYKDIDFLSPSYGTPEILSWRLSHSLPVGFLSGFSGLLRTLPNM